MNHVFQRDVASTPEGGSAGFPQSGTQRNSQFAHAQSAGKFGKLHDLGQPHLQIAAAGPALETHFVSKSEAAYSGVI